MSHVAKDFGSKQVLIDASFEIQAREKVALVGRNGSGKSTITKLIIGEYEPDKGAVHTARGMSIGYLRQIASEDEGVTVREAAERACGHLFEIKDRIKEIESLPNHTTMSEISEEYALLQSHFIEAGGYTIERDVNVVLSRLGFAEHEHEKMVSSLSGGQQTRLAMAKLLLAEPELLILDEPTNHLDLQATEWLEQWVRGYGGAVLLVSHDREFLQNTCDRVLHLEDGIIKSYKGNFGQYEKLRREEAERLAVVAKRQEERAKKLDEFVRRFMNSERTAQARGRKKHLETLKSKMAPTPTKQKRIGASFGLLQRSGDLVLQTRNLGMQFNGQTLFSGLDWAVQRTEKWAIIGSNGVGKSTLAKLISQEIEPTSGEVRIGANVTLGVFHQDANNLNLSSTPLETIHNETSLDIAESRTLLGRLLFEGEEVFQPNSSLSGGERNKLSLAKLIASRPNLLILDEPTNHLDMDSRDALCDVLKSYDGTLILISHDRWLLRQVTNRVLEISPHGLRRYEGGFDDFSMATQRIKTELLQDKSLRTAPMQEDWTPHQLSKKIQETAKEVEAMEKAIAVLEAKRRQLETTIAQGSPDLDFHNLGREHSALQLQCSEAIDAWVRAVALLDQLRELQGQRNA